MHLRLPPRESISLCAHFLHAYVVRLTVDHSNENQARLPLMLPSGFRSRFPRGCVVGQVLEMARIDPGDSIQYIQSRDGENTISDLLDMDNDIHR